MAAGGEMEPAETENDRAGALASSNPATGTQLGEVALTAPDEVAAVVDAVRAVQPFWAGLPLSDRARYMRRTAQVVIDQIDELSVLVAREQGRPLGEVYAREMLLTIDALHWIAEHGERVLGDERVRYTQPFLRGKRSLHSFEPLGAVAVIAAASDPWSAPFGHAAVALMCGNGVVVKPSAETPLIGARIQAVFERAGLPEGIVCTVQGDAEVGRALVDSHVAKVFFSGSADAGAAVAERAAGGLKGAVLELGGKDAQLVLADARLDDAVAGCLWGAYANSGQSSAAIERVYVASSLADDFTAAAVDGARALTVGDPVEWSTEIGPLVSRERFERVCGVVDEAVAEGAELRCGGPVAPAGLDGRFYAPAVLSGVEAGMRVMREQVPGPVIAITEVADEEQAIALANGSPYGLGASVWTLDRGRGMRIARRLEAGSVWINDHLYSHGVYQCSWGGVKRSGLGRSQSRFGFHECVNVKHIAWEPSRIRDPWWFPYDESLGAAAHAAAQLLYGRDADKRDALRRGAAPLARLARKSLRI